MMPEDWQSCTPPFSCLPVMPPMMAVEEEDAWCSTWPANWQRRICPAVGLPTMPPAISLPYRRMVP